MIYQIANWDALYENSRSREIDTCKFVCVPNKQHGMGFKQILAQPDGAALYGIFHCILGACSRQKRPRAGWLTEDGQPNGLPWEAADLSVQFTRPEKEVKRALEILTSRKVGWLVVHNVKEGDLLPETAPVIDGKIDGLDEFVSAWNAKAGPVFGKCVSLSDGRKKSLRSRLSDAFWRDRYMDGIERMGGSDFLRGKNDRGWRASIDFFLRPDTLAKTIEGKYDNHDGNGSGRSNENQI